MQHISCLPPQAPSFCQIGRQYDGAPYAVTDYYIPQGPDMFKERDGLQLDFTEEFDERDVFLHPGDDMCDDIEYNEGEEADFTV